MKGAARTGSLAQLLDLTLLAPDIPARVLDGVEPLSERQLRAVVGAGTWEQQRRVYSVSDGGHYCPECTIMAPRAA